MARWLELCLLGLLPSWAARLAAPTGLKKVVSLLENMKQELVAEGEQEQQNFDKFNCYCQSQRESLSAELSAAEKRLPSLLSETEALEASAVSLEAELKKDSKDRKEATEGAEEVRELREKTSQESRGRLQALSKNLQALDSAIGLLRQGASFLQMPTLELEEVVETHLKPEDARTQEVLSFLEGSSEGSPMTSLVLGTLESLKDQLQQDYNEAKAAQNLATRDFAALMRSKTGEGRSLQEQLGKKSQRLGDLKLRLVETRKDAAEVKKLKMENYKLLSDLTESCDRQAAAWKQRWAVRGDELAAVSEALEEVTAFQTALVQEAVSFLQLPALANAAAQKLAGLGSVHPRTQFIMLALKGKKIGTDEVMRMIDKMVENLEEEKTSEAKKKQNCRGEYRLVASREGSLQSKQQQAEESLRDVQELFLQMEDDLKRMDGSIQELDNSVEKATELRKAERLSHSELKSHSLETQEMLESATKRLERTFRKRDDGSFLEEVSSRFHHRHRVTDADADTSARLGSKSRALGVIGLLQRILEDAKLELKETEMAERRAEAEYQGFLKDAAAKRSEEKFALVQKRSQKATLAAELQNSKVLHATTKKEELANQEYRLAVDKDCEWLLKSWKDRVDARDREVEALRQAKATLTASSQELSLASLVVISGAMASFGAAPKTKKLLKQWAGHDFLVDDFWILWEITGG